MAHVHYKFSSKLKYDTMVFDGLHITLRDLKRQIMDREKLRAADCDLQITNAQTKEEYKDEEDLITKNSSVIVRRIPMVGAKSSGKKTSKTIVRSDHQFHHHAFGVSKAMDNQSVSRSRALLSQTCNLANADVSEEDKIQAMMTQSNHEYDPINYVKKHTLPPPNYTCFRCGLTGHHIRNCPTNGEKTFEALPNIKKSTGIPRSFMVEVDDPTIKGAMLTSCGRYAIHTIDAEAYAKGKKERPPFAPLPPEAVGGGAGGAGAGEESEAVPTELLCPICREMLHDAVLIPCCGNSYCDDCIRSALLESDEHVCPTCDKAEVSPDTLVANKFLRQAVNSFKNEIGHTKNQTAKESGSQVSQTPNPPPLESRPTRPQRPYVPTRHQQDPLVAHIPPVLPAPLPSVQQSAASPVATGASSAYSTPVGSPYHPDTPGSKEAEGEGSIEAADASIPPASPSPEEDPGHHVPVAEVLESTSPNPPRMSPSHPTGGHTEQPLTKESSSTSSSLAGGSDGGNGGGPKEDTCASLPPPHPPSGSSPAPAAPSPLLPPAPPPPHHFYPPPPSHFPSRPFPHMYPGYPFSAPPWAPPPLPPVCPAVPPSSTTAATSSIPPLIPKDEMYQHKRRVKKRASSSRGAHRSRQSPQRPQRPQDGVGSDFTKELLEYRRFQKQRRRSCSRSPQRSSSVSHISSDSYSNSYSRSRSHSRSPSWSRSRSRSRSSSRPRHRGHSVRRHANRSQCHGYKRSRSPTSPSSSPSRRMRSSRSRSPRGSVRKDSSSRHRHHATRSGSRRGHSGRQRRSASVVAHYQQYADCDAESYRQWEREFMEWYDKYFGSYTGKPHHLQPPPLPPKPRDARGVPPVLGSTHRPDSDSHPKPSPSPASNAEIGSLSYQQQCTVICGQQASDCKEPEMPGPTPEHSVAMPTSPRTSPVDLNDKRKKRRRHDRVGDEEGEAEESASLDDHNHHLDSHESRSAKPWWDGEDPRKTQGTKQRKLKSTTEGPVSGSLAKSSLWEGAAMKVKKPQSKTIKLKLNLGGQLDEGRTGGQSEQMAGRSTEEGKGDAGDEKVEATIETGVQEDVEDDGEMGETPVHTSRDGSERRHERKMPLKSLETHSSQGSSLLVPEDKMVPMQGPRSKWDQVGEDAEVSGGNQEPTSTEVQSTGTAALGSAAVSVAAKPAAARAGGTLDHRVGVPHQWETEGERERGRTWETARKAASPVCKEPSLALERRASPGDAERAHKPSRAGRGPRMPGDRQGSGEQRAPQAVNKDRKREEPEGRAEEREQASEGADTQKRGPSASRTSSSSCTARDNKRVRDPEDRRVVRDPEGRRVAPDPEGRRVAPDPEGRRVAPDPEGRRVVRDPEGRRVAPDPEGRRVVRDPEDGRKRKREHERCSGGNSQTSSSSSSSRSSSSSSSFSQPDAYPQRTAATAGGIAATAGGTAATAGGIASVDGSSGRRSSSRHREYDAQPHYDGSAYEVHQEPQDRQGDADALKYHQQQQHRRYLNQDHNPPHYHVREHKEPLQPRGRPPPPLLASDHVRGDQGPAHPGGAQAVVADRGQDGPCRSDVFSRGWDAPLRPRKPIDIKIISGASLFQHANPEKKDRL